jgi:hypothetical protein
MDPIYAQADQLQTDQDFQKAYDLLKPLSSDAARKSDSEFLWRWARACYSFGKEQKEKSEEKRLMHEGMTSVTESLKLKDECSDAHKWYAIIQDQIAQYEGTKKRIEGAFETEKHLKRAIELAPTDSVALHSMGVWHFEVSDLSWLMRKFAETFFAAPPKSTYENALKCFLDSENARPNFYSMNVLFVGKTYVRLKQNDKAKEYLLRARDWEQKTADDKRAREEALKLLKEIGYKEK